MTSQSCIFPKNQVSWPGWRPFRGISSPGKQSLNVDGKHDKTWWNMIQKNAQGPKTCGKNVFWWLPKFCCLSFPRHECWVLPSSYLILVSQNDLQKDPRSSCFLSRNTVYTLNSQQQRQVACSASPRRSIDSGSGCRKSLGFQDIIVRSLKFSTEVFSWVLNPSFLSLKLTNKIRADLQEYLQGPVVFNTSLSSVLQFVFFPIFFFLLLNLCC